MGSKGSAVQRRWIAILLAVAVAWVAASSASAQSSDRPDGKLVRIAILPMVVHSADDPKFIREGFRDMLEARIDQIEPFEIIDVMDPSKATTSLGEALETAREVDADIVLFGSFTRFGQGASLDVQMAATEPKPGQRPVRQIFVHSGSIGEIIPDLDKLVGKLGAFALEDYDHEPASTPGQGETPAVSEAPPDPLEELTARIEALESAMADFLEAQAVAAEAGAP